MKKLQTVSRLPINATRTVLNSFLDFANRKILLYPFYRTIAQNLIITTHNLIYSNK